MSTTWAVSLHLVCDLDRREADFRAERQTDCILLADRAGWFFNADGSRVRCPQCVEQGLTWSDRPASQAPADAKEGPGHWPLGINPDMDRHAATYGLPHWSCTDPHGNAHWRRRDGQVCEPTFRGPRGYLDDLAAFDRDHPMDAAAPADAKGSQG